MRDQFSFLIPTRLKDQHCLAEAYRVLDSSLSACQRGQELVSRRHSSKKAASGLFYVGFSLRTHAESSAPRGTGRTLAVAVLDSLSC